MGTSSANYKTSRTLLSNSTALFQLGYMHKSTMHTISDRTHKSNATYFIMQ